MGNTVYSTDKLLQIRLQFRLMVMYILPEEDHDKDVIENYVDSLMLGAEEYHQCKINN